MLLLLTILLLAIGAGEAAHWQRLSCPLGPEHGGLQRVWCRRLSAHCCSGFVFQPSARLVDGGRLKVSQHRPGSPGVTVEAVGEAPLAEGVYWCGVLGPDGRLIKLAESFIHGSFASYTWSTLRWAALPLLPVPIIFTWIFSRTR